MADPKGFLKTGREVAPRRPVEERVNDWQEVYPDGIGRALLPIINTQAGRCMDCGIPFCHQGCPLGNIIPEWNDLVWRDDWDGAIERLHATNNFPEFTGRLCPAPCETACVLGINQDPVTIKNVEVSIIDRAWQSGAVRPQPPEWLSGRTVAVIGSGPSKAYPPAWARRWRSVHRSWPTGVARSMTPSSTAIRIAHALSIFVSDASRKVLSVSPVRPSTVPSAATTAAAAWSTGQVATSSSARTS